MASATEERTEQAVPQPDTSLVSWLWLLLLGVVLAVVGNLLFDSSLLLWLVFVAIGVVAAVVGAQTHVNLSQFTARVVAVASFIVIPAVVGFVAWRTSGTPQWLLRFAIGAVFGGGGGVLVGSGVYRQSGDLVPRSPFMQFLHSYRQGADTMAGVLGVASAVLVFPTVAISVTNVVLRRIGASQGRNLTSNSLIEAQWYMYGLIFIFGLAFILRDGVNVRVDFWFGERSSNTQSWIDLVGHMIGLLPLAYIGIKYSWPSVELSWANQEKSPDAGGLYRPPIKTALMMAFVFLGIAGIADMIKNVEFLRGHELRRESDNPALAGGVSYDVDEFDIEVGAALGGTSSES